MKNRLITGILSIILGSLIAFGPLTIFPVCGANGEASSHDSHTGTHMSEHQAGANADDGSDITSDAIMKDYWTARAELGVGMFIALLGILLIGFPSKQIRLGISLSLALSGILVVLFPTVLIGVCDDAHAPCRLLTLPSLLILGFVVIVLSAANVVFLYKTSNEGQIRT